MTSQSVAEYALVMRRRYELAKRAEKGRILDEFCETTGMHRKAAIRLLNQKPQPALRRGGRPRRYGPEVSEALVKVWQVGDRMCGKLLAAVMAELVEALERHGELSLAPSVRSLLFEISPATIDRLLSRHRRRLGVQPQRRQAVSSSLKSEIPIRTWGDWAGTPVGSLQADLVLHCGERAPKGSTSQPSVPWMWPVAGRNSNRSGERASSVSAQLSTLSASASRFASRACTRTTVPNSLTISW